MQYGLEWPNGDIYGDARIVVKLTQLAEEREWDGVFLEDDIVHWRDEPTCDP